MTDRRARLIARINPAKLRRQAIAILEQPSPHPRSVALATAALKMATFADGGLTNRIGDNDGIPSAASGKLDDGRG